MSLCLASGRNLQQDDGFDDGIDDDGNPPPEGEDDGIDDDGNPPPEGDDDGFNQQGCCSWHSGVCGCSGGRTTCCDGSFSPSCQCGVDAGFDDGDPPPEGEDDGIDDDGNPPPEGGSGTISEWTPSPTPRPTRSPTRSPTPGPTPERTPSPIPEPTPGPTPSPTSEPTPGPTTESPTTNPTKEIEVGAPNEATEPSQSTQSSSNTYPLWAIVVTMLLLFLLCLVSGWNVHYCLNRWS
jgi:hypothetical protein